MSGVASGSFGNFDTGGAINPWTVYYQSQKESNNAIAAQQDMTDRATLRGLAPGLATRDPDAVAGAVVLPGIGGHSSVGTLGNYDAQRAAANLAAREFDQKYVPVAGDVVAGGPGPASGAPTSTGSADVEQLNNMIWGNESGGAATSATSVNGARGGHQIIPGTFAQYAKAGENIDNPTDNANVGRRIVADLAQKFGNDPARVAVAYFSGPGNVAPPGSPTPWLQDKKDGNGTATSAYVQNALGRLGGPRAGMGAPAGQPAAGPVAAVAPSGGPTALPDDHNFDHAIAVSGGIMQAILEAPADQRPALWQKYRPIMIEAGALNAPVDYPGDQAAATMREAAFNPEARARLIAAHRGGGTQVAGPGAPTAPASSGVPPPMSVSPDYNSPAAFAERNAPPIPNENPMLAMGAPAAPPQNAMLPQTPVAALPARPATAPTPSSLDPPPGAVIQNTQTGQRFPGAPPGMAMYKVPGHKGSLPFRDPSVPEPFEVKESGDRRDYISKLDNRVIRSESIPTNTRGTVMPAVRKGVPGVVLKTPSGGEVPNSFEASPTRPALGTFEVQKEDYKRDQDELPKIAENGQQAQTSQVRIQAMRDLASKISTGAAGNTRAQWANIAETAGMPGVARALISNATGGDAAAAQEFAKLSLISAGAAERGDLGSRGSLGALQIYKAANPGLDLRPDANKNILGMQLIAAQADADYATGALKFGNEAASLFRAEKPYVGLSNFNQQWQTQKNPQIYAAAMGALNGEKFDSWTKALNTKSPEDVKRVLDILRRADPTAQVLWDDGKKHAVSSN
jgi:hypothetical protein